LTLLTLLNQDMEKIEAMIISPHAQLQMIGGKLNDAATACMSVMGACYAW
jgi:hypothetical protein